MLPDRGELFTSQNMEKPTIYVAGKVSGLPDLNKPLFDSATKELRAFGYIVRNPHEICHGKKEDDWNGCMRECIAVLVKCNLVVLLPGWMESKGATLEYTIARSVGIRCIEYADFINDLKNQKDGLQ